MEPWLPTQSRGQLWTSEGRATPRSPPAAPGEWRALGSRTKHAQVWPGLEQRSVEFPHRQALGAHRHDYLLNISPEKDSF